MRILKVSRLNESQTYIVPNRGEVENASLKLFFLVVFTLTLIWVKTSFDKLTHHLAGRDLLEIILLLLLKIELWTVFIRLLLFKFL